MGLSLVFTASNSLNEGFPHYSGFPVGFVVGYVVVPVWFQDCCPLVHYFLRPGGCHCAVLDYNTCWLFVALGSNVFGYLEVVIVHNLHWVCSCDFGYPRLLG